ncbi:septation ring formation regulator EzrA [Ectobacillus antri]|uniref:Septation ring formation regulator EzrA n=1 Tax=Ectobacillus antri TaxID=2486280 RepID=A0ABT6H3F3_9BACI|nr:septation ring formation regulator EzrA [Ectobacillus antri]MDG4656500.1 septation ring formation regulator EzrA [Ectobacillus antri]MDG5753550.1 septation ring formation regulator EzrA [Ectobacillus antri]
MGSLLTFIIVIISIILIYLLTGLIIKNRADRELQELKAWKQALKDKPVADELKKVKDLNMTGQTEALFEKWRNEWDEVLTVSIPQIEKDLQEAESSLSGFLSRKSRLFMEQAGGLLVEAEEKIEGIVKELHNLLESHTKNNAEIEVVRSAYREVKKNMLAYRHTVSLAEKKLEELLDQEHQKFQQFEEATVNGNYLEARDIVRSLEQGVAHLQTLLEDIPDLQLDCQANLPGQISDLLLGYQEMEEQGYILHHLQIDKEVQDMQHQIQLALDDIKTLRVHEAKARTESVKNKLDSLYDVLENEVTAKYHAEKEQREIGMALIQLREKSNQTKEETQFVKQSYELSDEDVEAQKYVEKQVVFLMKRFEALQIRIAEQDVAFSVIGEELSDVRKQIEETSRLHAEYTDMLATLRKEELQARETLQQMRSDILEVKRLLQKSNIPGVPQDMLESLAYAQVAVRKVYEQLEYKPLNMNEVHKVLKEAQGLVLGMSSSVKELIEQAALVEKMIQYGNRYRSQSRKVADHLAHAEVLFRQYQYKAALEQVSATLEQIEPGVTGKIEEFVRTE